MLTMKKIFLIGSERSGTNLLRVLFGNHSRISAPPPIHLLDLFESRTSLLQPAPGVEAEALARKLEAYVNHDFSDWRPSLPSDSPAQLSGLSAFVMRKRLYVRVARAG